MKIGSAANEEDLDGTASKKGFGLGNLVPKNPAAAIKAAAMKKAKELQFKLILKTVEEVWPSVDTLKKGKIGPDQVIELARLGLEKANLK